MWELDYKESWVLKNWCFWTVVLEKTLKSSLDCKEIQPVHPKGNQSWIFIGRRRCWSWSSNPLATWCKELTHLKRPWCWERLKAGGEGDDRGRDGWMASPTRWHEFEQVLLVGDGQGSLGCCSPWGCKESDMTERLNNDWESTVWGTEGDAETMPIYRFYDSKLPVKLPKKVSWEVKHGMIFCPSGSCILL